MTTTKDRKFIIIILLFTILALVWQYLAFFFRVASSNGGVVLGNGYQTIGIVRPGGGRAVEKQQELPHISTLWRLEEERAKSHQLQLELSKLHGRKRQRIALMFTGAPRTLTQTGVMTSHVVNVIDALSAGGRDLIDIFFHLNNGTSDGAVASRNSYDEPPKPFTYETLEKLKNLTSPVEVILHADSSCYGLGGAIANHSCCSTKWPESYNKWVYNFLQFAYLRESFRSVKRYERDKNIAYDWFVRLRPDVACFEPMPAARSLSTRRFYLQTKERELGSNTNDYIFIVPKNLANEFFEEQIMTVFDTSCPKGFSFWPAESTMFNHLPNLPYQALPLPCVHVTGPTTAECKRFTRWDQSHIPSIYDIDGSNFAQGQTFEAGCNKAVEGGYFGNQNHLSSV